MLRMTVPPRALRAAAVGLPTLQLALAAHVAGGGCVERVPALVATALCLAGGWTATRAQTTTTQLLVLLSAAQVAVHGLLACSGTALHVSAPMLAAHAVAVVGTAVLLSRADAALRGAARLRARLASYRLVLVAVPRLVAPVLPQPAPVAVRTRLHDAGVRSVPARRGPPALLLRAA